MRPHACDMSQAQHELPPGAAIPPSMGIGVMSPETSNRCGTVSCILSLVAASAGGTILSGPIKAVTLMRSASNPHDRVFLITVASMDVC